MVPAGLHDSGRTCLCGLFLPESMELQCASKRGNGCRGTGRRREALSRDRCGGGVFDCCRDGLLRGFDQRHRPDSPAYRPPFGWGGLPLPSACFTGVGCDYHARERSCRTHGHLAHYPTHWSHHFVFGCALVLVSALQGLQAMSCGAGGDVR